MLSSGISKQTNSDMQFLSIDNLIKNLIFYTDLDLMSPWSKLRAGAEEDLYVIPWGQFHCEEKASLNQLIDKALNLVIELSIDYSIN